MCEINQAKGNGDPKMKLRLGVSIERCDGAILEISDLLVLKGLCKNFFHFHCCFRDLVKKKKKRSISSSFPSFGH